MEGRTSAVFHSCTGRLAFDWDSEVRRVFPPRNGYLCRKRVGYDSLGSDDYHEAIPY